MELLDLILDVFKKPYILFNIDVVGAKTGKKLNWFKKLVNLLVNAICAYTTIIVALCIAIVLAFYIVSLFHHFFWEVILTMGVVIVTLKIAGAIKDRVDKNKGEGKSDDD